MIRQDRRLWMPEQRMLMPQRRHLIGAARAGAMAAAGSGAAGIAVAIANLQTPISTTSAGSTASANATGIVAGAVHLVIRHWDQSGSGTPVPSATLGGEAVTQIYNSAPPLDDMGIWIGQITPGSSGALSLAIASGGVSWGAVVASIVRVDGFGSFGTPATAYATATSYAGEYTTTAANVLILGLIAMADGNLPYTPDATAPTAELLDIGTGAGSTSDVRAFIGVVEAPTIGAYTWGASWGTSREFARYAVELKP